MNWQPIVDLLCGCDRDQKQLLRDMKASVVLRSATSLGPVELE